MPDVVMSTPTFLAAYVTVCGLGLAACGIRGWRL